MHLHTNSLICFNIFVVQCGPACPNRGTISSRQHILQSLVRSNSVTLHLRDLQHLIWKMHLIFSIPAFEPGAGNTDTKKAPSCSRAARTQGPKDLSTAMTLQSLQGSEQRPESRGQDTPALGAELLENPDTSCTVTLDPRSGRFRGHSRRSE